MSKKKEKPEIEHIKERIKLLSEIDKLQDKLIKSLKDSLFLTKQLDKISKRRLLQRLKALIFGEK